MALWLWINTILRGDARYRHLLNGFGTSTKVLERLFGSAGRREKTPGEIQAVRSNMDFGHRKPAPGGPDAELARLRRMRGKPPFLCKF